MDLKNQTQREIKFRAWITTDVDDEDNDIKSMTYDLAFTKYATINELLNKQEDLMQFTGLQDKNGVDIYEGDILTYNGITSNGNKIIREVNYNVENARFQSGMYLLSQSIELSEIIGNIYERGCCG